MTKNTRFLNGSDRRAPRFEVQEPIGKRLGDVMEIGVATWTDNATGFL